MTSKQHVVKDSGPGAPHLQTHDRPSGFDLFLRFADGCRHYLEDRRAISPEDGREIRLYLENRGVRPSEDILRRVYYVAYPGLEGVRARLRRRSIFERDVVREFYAFDHNRMKFEQGNLICIAYPARVRDVKTMKGGGRGKGGGLRSSVLVELEPVTGMFTVETSIPLRRGDWVIMHRMNVIERVDKAFADRVINYLRKLGLDKSRAFPRKAYKYLTDLKFSGNKRT